jgi:putative nucleotidyltransferase with HDIG domain
MIAHDFKHVDRVRKWALLIAEGESYKDLQVFEVAALLHDIGLPHTNKESERGKHGEVGAEIAGEFLRENSTLTKESIEQITSAIRYHSSPPSLADEVIRSIVAGGRLIEIIRDADTMDALGAVGLIMAFTSKYFLPEYDPRNIRGETWELSSDGFTERMSSGPGIGEHIIDQMNFQISYFENLHTNTGRRLVKPLVRFMKDFVLQLEDEISFSNIH